MASITKLTGEVSVCLRDHLSSWLKPLVLLSKVATWDKHRPDWGESLQTQAVKSFLAMSMPTHCLVICSIA
nr:hypothetical protein [Pontibacter ummariensis]